MARKTRRPKSVETLSHEDAARKNIPPAELQSLAQKLEEADPVAPASYPRTNPLLPGEKRLRREGLDPQIVWSGGTLTLTDEQIAQLTETGKVEIGEAQLVWRGKDEQDWSDLIVQVPQIYLQEKVHPKAIIDDLKRMSERRVEEDTDAPDLFADFNGIEPEARTEFYQHDMNWQNRMILGDSLQAMASLAEREHLRGKVQCIYFDPPYGIKFNSNWQVSTRSRDVKDGKQEEITREPEQVKAFRDTWKDGIHSYLTYLRDRLTVMRDLLTVSGSIFVQIGDKNVHRVRAVMDEVFGEENFVEHICYRTKNMTLGGRYLEGIFDNLLWYSRSKDLLKFRKAFRETDTSGDSHWNKLLLEGGEFRTATRAEINAPALQPKGSRLYQLSALYPAGAFETGIYNFRFEGKDYDPPATRSWKSPISGMRRLDYADRIEPYPSGDTIRYRLFFDDYPISPHHNVWLDTAPASDKSYVVQTAHKVIQRCVLMTTDPGDLVLDPTCGSGTTATVAEQWGRRWITMDTSRVALALARARIMGARYPYYLLTDSADGRDKAMKEFNELPPDISPTNNICDGFVYERAPHITLKSIANNAEIDVIWDKWQETLEPLRRALNESLERTGERVSPADCGENGPWEEWEIPRRAADPWPDDAVKEHAKAVDNTKTDKMRSKSLAGVNAMLGRTYTYDTLPEHPDDPWDNEETIRIHGEWWKARIARQQEIDKSIANKADVEFLYDRPFIDNSKVRVAGPFTVESLSPHRMISADDDDGGAISAQMNVDRSKEVASRTDRPHHDFAQMVLENLAASGVQQARKEDRINIQHVEGWPGDHIAARAAYESGAETRMAAVFIGPEFGTITRPDLIRAVNEAAEMGADTLIACGFAYDAHTSELTRLGPVPILKARMNPDLHMAGELKNTGSGNLFVVFGEPDLDWHVTDEGKIVIEVNGVDVYDPKKREVRASGKDDIAAWFIDTDYDSESFFVRHAYFLGANDPYKSLKTSLRDEIDEDAWASLHRDISRPFDKPESGQFAVKVINHFGDEVMKVFRVE